MQACGERTLRKFRFLYSIILCNLKKYLCNRVGFLLISGGSEFLKNKILNNFKKERK